MTSGSLRLFSVAGIEVRVHVSWLVVFALISWSLADGVYTPDAIPGIQPSEAWLMAALSAILLFASVLVHELAHSLVALARGLQPHSITLFIFGGVSTLGADAPRASTEFLVAIVGPLSSFVIAALALLVAELVTEPRLETLFSYLGLVNFGLGLFNLVPGFPLDGGRVLRAVVWQRTGDARRGLEVAASVGQAVGYLFMIWGVVQMAGGDLVSGIWIAAIGWFLQGTAASTLQTARQENVLRRVRVRDVYRTDTITISPQATVAELIDGCLMPGNRRAVPVAQDGRLVGMVTIADIQGIPPTERGTTRIEDVMGGRDAVVTVRPESTVNEALTAMLAGNFEQLPVTDGGRMVGMLSMADIARQIQLREALRLG